MEYKKNITDLIKGIDEFDNKYITYRATTLRKILEETLAYIEQKEQEYDDLTEKVASIMYLLTGGRLSSSTYTLEACEQAYHDQLEIDVGRATKELQEQLKHKERKCEILNSDNRYFVNQITSLELLTDKYEIALDNIESYCKKCNLKADFTACDILDIIDEVKDN